MKKYKNYALYNIFQKSFIFLLYLILILIFGFSFFRMEEENTDAKTTNNTYTLYSYVLSNSPQSYSESTPGIININDYKKASEYSVNPGTMKVNVEIVKSDGGGCTATPSSEVNASSDTVNGSSYAHGFVGQTYEYKVTYIVKPNSGFQVYQQATMDVLNPSADKASSSLNNINKVKNKEKILFSNSTWTSEQQSVSISVKLGSHTGTSTVNNSYHYYWMFAPVRYTVKFNVDKNSTYYTSYVDYYHNYSVPSSTPTKTGYKFLGWFTAESGGTQVTSSTIKKSAQNETLYAHWEKLSYRINVNILNPSGVEDGRCGTFSQTYNGQTKDNLRDQYYATMYIGETMTFSNIIPAIGYALVSVDTNNGTITENGGGSYTFTANFKSNPAGSSTWDAVIEIKMKYANYFVSIDTQGGTYKGETSPTISSIYKQVLSLTTPSKEGYIFKGWEIVNGEPTLLNNQYFSQAQEFDGVDDYINIGREKMYSDKITIAFNAYMDNWADYGSNNMRMISCTETGGWNFGANSGKIQFAIYDKGYGYKSITVDKSWSTLESGWHSFVATFDGTKASLYIDNVLLGSSANFSSGLIGYNSNNSIFIGAEAASNTSSPYGQYFKGKIQNLIIVNECVNMTNLSTNADYYLITSAENIEIKALWEETWTAHTQPFNEGDGSEENPYKISSAEQLAYLSKQVYNGEMFNEKYFELTSNVDLSQYYWQPIGIFYDRSNTSKIVTFAGNFNGNNYKITGLKTMNGSTYAHNYQGLFGCTAFNASISNVILEDSDIKGANYVGGIVAIAGGNTILKNNYVFGNVVGSEYTGGIAGRIAGTTSIENSYNFSTINAYKYVGGIAGANDGGTKISNSLNSGSINAITQVGGIVGQVGGTVIDCGNEAGVSGQNTCGALVGNVVSGGSLTNCYSIAEMNVNKIFGTNSGTVNNVVTVISVGENINKNYIGDDFSGFAWFNKEVCPLPKNLAFAGQFVQNVTIENLTEAGFVLYS